MTGRHKLEGKLVTDILHTPCSLHANRDSSSAVCSLEPWVMMMFVFDNELGIKLSVRIQKRKDNKQSSMLWLKIEDGDLRRNRRDTTHEMRARLAIPGVIVTDHRALESGVWSSPRIVQDNWTIPNTDRVKNLQGSCFFLNLPSKHRPRHLWS